MQLFSAASEVLALNLSIPAWYWVALFAWFLTLIIVDVMVLHRKDHAPSLKSAIWQSVAWIGMGVLLGAFVWRQFGSEAGGQYFAGYLVEKSLSIDNVFAWALILGYFKIPKKYQHRVLFWGVIGAIILRTIFVFAGIAVIERFEPILLVFGGILLWSGIKILRTQKEHTYDPRTSRFYRVINKFIKVSHGLDGHKLFTRENAKLVATPLFMALLVVEFTDVVFAVDSVPAILAVSREPFIIIASNAAAILGMRALYFVFAMIKESFWLLNDALGLLLVVVGVKMLIAPSEVFGIPWFNYHLPTLWSLFIILGLLVGGIVGSLVFKQPGSKHEKKATH
jgi:tellurite resistance protein TerC